MPQPVLVVPAKAGTQGGWHDRRLLDPAFAGVTQLGVPRVIVYIAK
jgi:hypothetical protein